MQAGDNPRSLNGVNYRYQVVTVRKPPSRMREGGKGGPEARSNPTSCESPCMIDPLQGQLLGLAHARLSKQ